MKRGRELLFWSQVVNKKEKKEPNFFRYREESEKLEGVFSGLEKSEEEKGFKK